MITLKQLNYALAVDKTRHFKKAAEMCAVSQSALSTAISELESQLGIQIFERNNKQVLVTAIGKQALAKAQGIKLEVEDLYQLSNQQKAPLSFPLSMGVIPTIGPYLLPQVLPAVREQFPDLNVYIEEAQTEVLIDKVRKGELDIAIIALPYDIDGLHVFEFWQEDFYVVVHKQHALAKHKNIDASALHGTSLLLLKNGHCLKDHALAACQQTKHDDNTNVSATSLYTLIQMAAGKMGATLVPHMALKQLLLNNAELSAIPLSDAGPHRRIAFISRLNYSGVNNIELLMDLFKKELKT